jgi:hypothetical protein
MYLFPEHLIRNPLPVPPHWKEPCVHSECSLHQLSPYIGKLKSSIARELISTYSNPGDLVVDPFAGSGTIPLEAVLQDRRAFAADISPYARILCEAKLNPPATLERALSEAQLTLTHAEELPQPDLRKVPTWVRQFFHPKTLKKAINFARVCREQNKAFLFACFLGILHHQRPGFLSYPSSHLVPYLRHKKYPRNTFPEMYNYRELGPRLLAKIKRTYSRFTTCFPATNKEIFKQRSVALLDFPTLFDCIITSPPYMNALEYGRDNRLRLWFIEPGQTTAVDNGVPRTKSAFAAAMTTLATKTELGLKRGGYCVLIVGDRVARNPTTHLSPLVLNIVTQCAPRLKLLTVIRDSIPDIRRSRRHCKGTKSEYILVFRKE